VCVRGREREREMKGQILSEKERTRAPAKETERDLECEQGPLSSLLIASWPQCLASFPSWPILDDTKGEKN